MAVLHFILEFKTEFEFYSMRFVSSLLEGIALGVNCYTNTESQALRVHIGFIHFASAQNMLFFFP